MVNRRTEADSAGGFAFLAWQEARRRMGRDVRRAKKSALFSDPAV
jgi:hypothetical protein